jgi:hypothetical protein
MLPSLPCRDCDPPPPPQPRACLPVQGSNGHVLWDTPDPEPALTYALQANLNWIRIDLSWEDTQPTQNGTPFWGGYGTSIQRAINRGMNVYVSVGGTPSWARANPGDGSASWLNAAGYAGWPQWVDAAVKAFPQVKVWGMWNEPNEGADWTGDAATYVAQILIPGADAVHANAALCQNCKVGAPDLSSGAGRIAYYAFWDAIANYGAGGKVDVVTVHDYGFNDDTVNGITSGTYTWQSRLDESRSPFQGRQFWITEFGIPVPTNAQYPESANTEMAFRGICNNYRVSGAFVYVLRYNYADHPYDSLVMDYGIPTAAGAYMLYNRPPQCP